MTDLSGALSGLQVTVEGLQNYTLYLNQQLLTKPDLASFSNYKTTWNNQLQSFVETVYSLNKEVDSIESSLMNLVLETRRLSGIVSSGYTGSYSSSSGLQETFETISKNLKQYPHSFSYSGEVLTGIIYTITSSSYVNKELLYSGTTLLRIRLTGNPVPSTALNKYLLYSGDYLTGVYYN